MELDRTIKEHDMINQSVVSAIEESTQTWGVKILCYKIKNLTPTISAVLNGLHLGLLKIDRQSIYKSISDIEYNQLHLLSKN